MEYIHFNPVKHGLVGMAKEWPFSTFHRYVKQGVYDLDWGGVSGHQDRGFGE
jgi:putative transposase